MPEVIGFYEFFAGGGLARLGLGNDWHCLFANEICEKKATAYRLNFGPSPELRVDDVGNVDADDLPGGAVLAWASFPCQDLSLAGKGNGLAGGRSGTFWKFWRLMTELEQRGRRVPFLVIENVVGLISANKGTDFRSLVEALARTGYRVGALVIDAALFVPQSRPRLFIVASASELSIPAKLFVDEPVDPWHSRRLVQAVDAFPEILRKSWIWWTLPRPRRVLNPLSDLLLAESEVRWHEREETERLLAMMSEANLAKVKKAQAYGKCLAGTIYKRIRPDATGKKVQRAEVRFDQVSGCLRTPTGGSSRQVVMLVHGSKIRTRLLDPREAARLMGVPDSYKLPPKYNDAYHVMGDGLAVPAVTWLEEKLLQPLAMQGAESTKVA